MANITPTSMNGSGSRVVNVTTLSASDTFTYRSGQVLVLNNVTAGALTPNLDGDGSTSISVQGYGQELDVSAGYDVPSIAAGESVAIPLGTISAWLKGETTVTGGDGIEAQLLSF